MSAEVNLLRERAAAARRIASTLRDELAIRDLLSHAAELEAKANELEAAPVLPHAAASPSGEPPIARASAALKPELPPEPKADDPKD